MLSNPIEKEIKHESKAVFSLTARQLVSACVGVGACLILYIATKLPLNVLIIPWTLIAILAGCFGWVQKDGMKFEHLLIKFFKRLVYKSQRLKYRTVNSYVRVYNAGYSQLRASTKTTVKKKRPKSAMKSYM